MTAPDPGLTDLIAAHYTWREVDEGGDYLVCACGHYFASRQTWAEHLKLVVEQHTNGRMASDLGADPQDYEIAWAAKLRWQARAEKAEATIARVEEAVNTAAAHRFDFDNTSIEGPGGKVGGPNNFFNGNRYVTNYVRAALEGES